MCDFNDLPSKEQLMYHQLWKDKDSVESLLNCSIVPRKNGNKPNSFFFEGNKETMDLLKDIFKIKNKDIFEMKYSMVTGGDGDEGRKIKTLHSSSLCALLFFYNVTREHPLTLDLDGRMIKFTKSVFEFKSPVIRNASNMDVVLYGKEIETGKKVIFLLESKFTEHYMSADNKLKGISAAYMDTKRYSSPFYKAEFIETLNLEIPTNEEEMLKEKKFDLKLKESNRDQEYYIGGIKQMISHYVGMRNLEQNNFYAGKKSGCHMCMEEAIEEGADIILGEILFGDDVEVMKSATERYSGKYRKLAEKMNQVLLTDGKTRLHVLKEDLSYSKLFKDKSYSVEDEIWKYYFGRDM